ncbi:MAG TPA: sterol desaturase family protein [Burkholderiaceae bacterium]|jgi:sterol desaturase/sphingolipid hydroxylase (fatty acid hydroxylase superfamily)
MVLSKPVFDVVFHPVVFACGVYCVHLAVFPLIERRWGARRIEWRKVLFGDVLGFLYLSFVSATAAHYLNRWIGVRGPWPASIAALPFLARLALYLVVADFLAYWIHRAAHLSAFWRIHRWHHAPTHMYWLAGTRTSILQQTFFSLPYIFVSPLLDVSPWWIANALLIFYTLTNSWMHMNVRWRLRWLDWLFVTPRTHHIHHSDQPAHYNSNFGVILSIWDRLFGTFTNPERVAQSAIRYGIGEKVPLARLAIGV